MPDPLPDAQPDVLPDVPPDAQPDVRPDRGDPDRGDGRVIDVSIEVPGTPEEVWQAIATGPGITSWFVPTEVDEREGGVIRQHFGEMGTDEGRVVSWEAPMRVAFEGGASMGRPLVFEWTVEAVSGDTCTVRLVNSGFG